MEKYSTSMLNDSYKKNESIENISSGNRVAMDEENESNFMTNINLSSPKPSELNQAIKYGNNIDHGHGSINHNERLVESPIVETPISNTFLNINHNIALPIPDGAPTNDRMEVFLGFIFLLSNVLSESLQLPSRLFFLNHYTKENSSNILAILWDCILTDCTVLVISLSVKIMLCIFMSVRRPSLTSPSTTRALKGLLRIDFDVTRSSWYRMIVRAINSAANGTSASTGSSPSSQNPVSVTSNSTPFHNNHHSNDDIESNLPSTPLLTGRTSTTATPDNNAANSSIPSYLNMIGLVHRTASGNNNNNANGTGNIENNSNHSTSSSVNMNHNNNNHNSFTFTSHSNPLISDDDDENDSQEGQEPSSIYLLKLKRCDLIDISFLVYRTILPFPVWFTYFDQGMGRTMLPFLYTFFKIIDLRWKIGGALEAAKYYYGNKLEFGHYATSEEMIIFSRDHNHSSECPICYEVPPHPVLLECNHNFCELCITEWLHKEKTCPVCRQEVKFTSNKLRSIKEEATSRYPLVI
eukprot:gene5879-8109_t